MSEIIHASCVARGERGILIAGRSGSGKSDLALRLLDRGAVLVSDDYTAVRAEEGVLIASAPANIAGKMEVRGIGIVDAATAGAVPVALFVDLDAAVERLPEPDAARIIAGIAIPLMALGSLEASAPIKVELALDHIGLPSR